MRNRFRVRRAVFAFMVMPRFVVSNPVFGVVIMPGKFAVALFASVTYRTFNTSGFSANMTQGKSFVAKIKLGALFAGAFIESISPFRAGGFFYCLFNETVLFLASLFCSYVGHRTAFVIAVRRLGSIPKAGSVIVIDITCEAVTEFGAFGFHRLSFISFSAVFANGSFCSVGKTGCVTVVGILKAVAELRSRRRSCVGFAAAVALRRFGAVDFARRVVII